MMDIRRLIKEQIQKVFEDNLNSDTLFGGALDDINGQLQTDLDSVGKIITTHQTDIKNQDNEIKADSQLQSKLDQSNPHKIGLTREIPEMKKDLDARKKQLQDLQNVQQGITDAQNQIQKQNDTMQNSQQGVQGTQKTQSVLPSIQSPI